MCLPKIAKNVIWFKKKKNFHLVNFTASQAASVPYSTNYNHEKKTHRLISVATLLVQALGAQLTNFSEKEKFWFYFITDTK